MVRFTEQEIDSLVWHTPRRNSGQIVEVSYAIDGESQTVLRCTHDRSVSGYRRSDSATYESADVAAVQGEWDPWCSVPEIDEAAWRPVHVAYAMSDCA